MTQTSNTTHGRGDTSRSDPRTPNRDADADRRQDRDLGHAGEVNPSDETTVGGTVIEGNSEDPGRTTRHPSATGTEWGMKSRGEESTPTTGGRAAGANEDAASMDDTQTFGLGQGDSGTNPEA